MKLLHWRECLVIWATLGLICRGSWAASNDSTTQSGAPAQAGNHWGFDDLKVGIVPTGWRVAQTGPKAKPAKWEVTGDSTAPSAPHVMALTKTQNTGDTYNLLMAEGPRLKDLNLEVKVKVISGKKNQGSGLIWRAQDPNNYYLARWTPLSNNFRVYCIKDGKARRLANLGVKVDRKTWHTIQVSQQGDKIKASLDGQKPIEVIDATLTKPGMIGLCTKADACATFDDLRAQEIPPANAELIAKPAGQ